MLNEKPEGFLFFVFFLQGGGGGPLRNEKPKPSFPCPDAILLKVLLCMLYSEIEKWNGTTKI